MRVINEFKLNALICILMMALSGVASVFLGQDNNWDLRNYHLYNAYALLNDRLLWDVASVIQFYLNPVLDLPYYFLVQFLGGMPKIVAFLQGSFLGASIFVFYKITINIFRVEKWSDYCFLFFMLLAASSGAITVSELGTTFNDIQIALIVLIALYLSVRGIVADLPAQRKCFWFAFFLVGLASGFKLTAAIYAIGLTGAILLVAPHRISTLFFAVSGGLFGFLVSGGYWAWRMWTVFGSPVFPFYNEIFKSPWWPARDLIDARFFPRDLSQWFFYPFYWGRKHHSLVTEVEFSEIRLAVVMVAFLLLAGLFFFRKKISSFECICWKKLNLLLAFFILSYLVWLKAFSIYRYATLLEIMSVLFVFLLPYLIFRSKAWVSSLSYLFIFGALFYFSLPANWSRIEYGQQVVEVNIPPIAENSIVFVVGDLSPPMSFLIPYFPDSTRFIILGEGLYENCKLAMYAREVVGAHTGNFYLLAGQSSGAAVFPRVRDQFGLIELDLLQTENIHSNIGDSFELSLLVAKP